MKRFFEVSNLNLDAFSAKIPINKFKFTINAFYKGKPNYRSVYNYPHQVDVFIRTYVYFGTVSQLTVNNVKI